MFQSQMSVVAVCVCTASLIACAKGPVATFAPENLDLSGSWVLNTDLSDDPGEMSPEGGMGGGAMGGRPGDMGGRRPPGGMGGGGGAPGGMGGRGGMRGPQPNQRDQERIMQTMRMAAPPPRRLVVEHHDSTITIRNAGGRSFELLTNWEKVRHEIQNDGELDIRARWEDRALHIERDVRGGGKVTQSYSLSSDGKRLLVEALLDMGRGQEQVFHYVYDREHNQP